MSKITTVEQTVDFFYAHKAFFLEALTHPDRFFDWMDGLEDASKKSVEAIDRKLHIEFRHHWGSLILALESPNKEALTDLVNQITSTPFSNLISFTHTISEKNIGVINQWMQEVIPSDNWAVEELEKKTKAIQQHHSLKSACQAVAEELAVKLHQTLADLYDPNSNLLGITPKASHSGLEHMNPESLKTFIANGEINRYEFGVVHDAELPGWSEARTLIAKASDVAVLMQTFIDPDNKTTAQIEDNIYKVCSAASEPGCLGKPRIQNIAEYPNSIINLFCKAINAVSTALFGKECFPDLEKGKNLSQQILMKQEVRQRQTEPESANLKEAKSFKP